MEVILERLHEDEFNKLIIPILFNDIATSRCFGVITNGKECFGLAWQSTIIQPELTKLNQNVFCVGIDRNFSIIDFDSYLIILKIPLFYNFITTELFKEYVYVITELEVVKIDRFTYSVIAEYGLPDLFEELIVGTDCLYIKCAENKIVEIW